MSDQPVTRSDPRAAAVRPDQWFALVSSLAIVAAFMYLSRINFLLFHSLVELFSVAVAWSAFILTWNARSHIRDDALLILGISSLFASILDLIHTLAYRGMGVFLNYDANLPTQLWIAARSLQALSVLGAFALPNLKRSELWMKRRVPFIVLACYSVITGLLLWVILAGHFPTCYVEGVGLTLFKRFSEYVISAILLVAGGLFWRVRDRYPKVVTNFIIASIAATVLAELAFTFYISVYGLSNVAGHTFKVVAYAALYLAVIRTGVQRPYALLSQQLQQSEFRYRHIYQNVSLGIVQVDLDLQIQGLNPAACRMLGYTEIELRGQQLLDLVYHDSMQDVALCTQTLIEGDSGCQISEMRFNHKSGRAVPVFATISLSRDQDAPQFHLLVSFTDISELKRAELEREHLLVQVRDQANRMARILDTVPSGVMLISMDGHVLLTNPLAVVAMDHLAEVNSEGQVDRLGGISLETLVAPTPMPWSEVKGGGRVYEIAARAVTDEPSPTHYVLVLNDVTEAHQVREELTQQAHLAAVGQLAAGIAHDFNNILASILLYADMDARIQELPGKYRAHCRIIAQQGRFGARLVQQILDFSRRSVLCSGPVDVVALVREQSVLLRRVLPKTIRTDTCLPDSPLVVEADEGRLQQIIVNLATNARDAMPDGGHLQIRVALRQWISSESVPIPDMPPGDWVEISVTDTGMGMTDDVLSHAFEPFFTTKPPGQGSGLGLAQVHGIVHQHKGHMDIQSEVGVGTTVRVLLPLADAAPPVDCDATIVETLVQGQGETVLVVEDSVAVRSAVASAVASLNYKVVEAKDGYQALGLLCGDAPSRWGVGSQMSGDGVDVVLCDMVMPRMSGQGFLDAMLSQGCDVPVIIMSAHPLDDRVASLEAGKLAGWLKKPVALRDLADLLARALRRAA